MKKVFNFLLGTSIVALSTISCTHAYTQEQQEAYQWAYKYSITTQPTIESANLEGNLTREAFAKMVVNYLENVVGINTTSNTCSFIDENNTTDDLKVYTKKSCAYEIMGKDGTAFNPKGVVDRAQLGTVFSRIIWGDKHNSDGKGYYIYHVNALQDAGIMNNIKNVLGTPAKRGDVMIMFKRMYEKFELNNLNKDYIKKINQLNHNNIPDELIEELDNNIDISLYGNIEYDNGEWKIYYPNGQLGAKGYFKNGKLDGEILLYHENGQLKGKGFFKNGELDGEITAYYENGQLQGKGFFKNGEPDGEIITYYENGKIESKENYKDGLEDGESVSYYENGQLESKENYKDGEYDGEQLEYYENGQLKDKGYFKDGNPDGEFVSYYENGQLGTKVNFKDWKYDGEAIDYYENGKIKDKGYFKDGNPDGEFVAYYENDQLKEKANYKNGELDGEIIAYYESGKLKAKGNYKDGKEDGKLVYYYEDGQVSLEINFKNGMFDGKYTRHFEDGKITEMNYKNGKEDGKQIGYYEDGSIRFLHNFKDGFGTKSYFDKKGNVIGTGTEMFTDEIDDEYEGTYKSILNGLEILYYENGQVYEISYYKDGELDGIQTIYYENGQIESKCNYTDGMEGLCTRYDEDGEEISAITTYSGIIDINTSERNGAILKNTPLYNGILQPNLGVKESKGTVNKEGKLDIENWRLGNNNEEKYQK